MKLSLSRFRKTFALLTIIFITTPMIAVPTSAADISLFINGVQMISDSFPINSGGIVFSGAFNTKVNGGLGLQQTTVTGSSNLTQSSSPRDYVKAKLQAAIDSLSPSVSVELNATDIKVEELFNPDEYGTIKSWSYEGKRTKDKTTITWKLEFFDEHAVITAYRNPALESKLTARQMELLLKCKGIHAEIIKPDMTDYQKQLAIHDYIVLNCEYDIEASISKTVTGLEDTFFAYGALINKKAVCKGYVEAANILLGMSNIESYSISSEDHSWNLVKLDDGYYHMDATWDDPTPDAKGRVRHDYFNLTDAQIAQYSSHNWLDKKDFPAAIAVKYNYFIYNDLVANNREDLKRILTKAIQAGEREVTVMVSNHRTGGYTWDKDLEFIFKLTTNSGKVAKFNYSPPNSERDTLIVTLGS